MDRNDLIGVGLLAWFIALAVAETVSTPPRSLTERSSDARLVTNFGFMAIIFLASTILPLSIAGASAASQGLHFGIAHRVGLPWAAGLILALLSVTLASYWAHRLMHMTPPLWRVHRVHHADSSVDVSTSFRNHPLELLITAPVSTIAILIIGPPLSVVVALQTLLVAAAIWQHADVPLPRRLDRVLSAFIFTPRLHRLHHNPERKVHDTNFGELIVLWDWLFGTLNLSEGRRRVGLENQAARSDRLLDQILSPIHPA